MPEDCFCGEGKAEVVLSCKGAGKYSMKLLQPRMREQPNIHTASAELILARQRYVANQQQRQTAFEALVVDKFSQRK